MIRACLLVIAAVLLLSAAATAQPPGGRGMGPPQEAFDACRGKSAGDTCAVGPGSGTCADHGRGLFCMPEGGPPGMRGGGQGPRMSGQQMGGMQSRGGGQQMARPGPHASYPADANNHPLTAQNPVPTTGVPDTGQNLCFDQRSVMACPDPGERYHGQDAQYDGPGPSYRDNHDGTVTDLLTGLTWQQAHNSRRLTFYPAKAFCENLALGGRTDWRLPSVKELYSITRFDGAAGVKPYVDMDFFELEAPESLSPNDRNAATHSPDMMGQTWTGTIYTGHLWDRPDEAAFFVNFLDGRIKSAPTRAPVEFFYRCVSGPAWGSNDFADQSDGTVLDRATGLMWQQADDGQPRKWADGLAYCEDLDFAGHDDWRLPNVHELEQIADYSRVPANNPAFTMTDPKAWFWSSTTLGDNTDQATYVCFGKCVSYTGVDVHGAGAQRSDPKSGSSPFQSQGGQQDEIRGTNYVRCVRN